MKYKVELEPTITGWKAVTKRRFLLVWWFTISIDRASSKEKVTTKSNTAIEEYENWITEKTHYYTDSRTIEKTHKDIS